MFRDLNAVTASRFQHTAGLTVLVCSLLFTGQAFAAKSGHGRVTSAPGQALQISLPLLDLNAQDQAALQVKVAAAPLWSMAGLLPPVSLESFNLVLKPGMSPDSREIVISSNQQAAQSPVDILLEVTTATGSTLVQSSYLVLLPAQVNNAGQPGTSVSLRVSSGNTLLGIAQRHMVDDADLYQVLNAIFEANPQAFIAGNMNLLRAGAVLNIPDAQTIRAVDKALARSTYQKHLAAFNQRRVVSNARNTPLVSSGPTQSGVVSAPASQEPAGEKVDHLKLNASSEAAQREDAKVSATKEIEELQSRILALQQNVKLLKDVVGDRSVESSKAAVANSASNAAQPGSNTASAPGSVPAPAPVPAPATTPNPANPTTSVAPVSIAGQPAPVPASVTQDTKSEGLLQTATNALNEVSGYLAKNILVTLTVLIALLALVVAWRVRKSGQRRDDAEDFYSNEQAAPSVNSAFDKKLQSINLDLDGEVASSNKSESSVHKPL